MSESCGLCPRKCGVRRADGEKGFCGMGDGIRAARAMLHHWEEPSISGTRGSGAVFFSGCTLQCVFCQNWEISHRGGGADITVQRLRDIFFNLIEQGAHNINLVTPTQFLPGILHALTPRLPVPVVYNCGGYERVETLRTLEGKVDIYLPDLKYASGDLGEKLSGAPDYFEVASAAIDEMLRQTGSPQFDKDGLMTRGVIIRHLVLPGHVDNSLRVLDYFAEHFRKGSVMLSLMAQYTPCGRALQMPPLDRHVTEEEYQAVIDWLYMLGIEDGYLQELDAADSIYIPDFSMEGIL